MVEVDNLVKHYGPIRAVNGVSFSVSKGEVLGFLGPNGAGKSTTMKMITCFLPPTSGTARVKGHDILTDPVKVREQLGYLPESAPLYEEMTVEKFLRFIAQVRGCSGAEVGKSVDRVFETTQIHKVAHQPIHTLSKGFRQRVCFAQALLHDPEVLILDEPTDGLDPNQKQAVRDLISSMKDEKVIILSTHILEEVDAICTRAIIISEGLVKVDGTPEELRRKSSYFGAVSLKLPKADRGFLDQLGQLNGIDKVERLPSEEVVSIRCMPQSGKEIATGVFDFLKDKGVSATEFHVDEGRLDEVFRTITRTVK